PSVNPLLSVTNTVYDGQSNITDRTGTFNGVSKDESLAYDPLDRLTSFTRGMEPTVTWQYDKAGNWTDTNQNGTAETRTVNDDNEYDLVAGLVPAHDYRGNMTSDGSKSYVYDWANRLITVKSGSQTLGSYTYDALNRRVAKTAGGITTTYVYDDGHVIEEYVNTSLTRSFVYGGGIDEPILMETGGRTYYYAADSLGSIRAMTDSTGTLVESYEYSPFGLMTVYNGLGQDITISRSAIGNPFGYGTRSPVSGITGTGCTLRNWEGSCSGIRQGMLTG
ncbi:MAG: hypothetical protein MI863_12180, partial [Desulfobacterales bacterium]|nr:hypothetical protein [Desulfobacterales bacterium]